MTTRWSLFYQKQTIATLIRVAHALGSKVEINFVPVTAVAKSQWRTIRAA